jgi:DNA-binding transcriptional LysR family regulator
MTLVQLRHLIELARTGSFSKAAQAAFLTQPALSRSIRALEDELGAPLFDRIGRKSELTPFGREVLARAQQMVFDADELTERGRAMQIGQAGTLRIGLGAGPAALLTTPLLLHMAEHHPRLQLDITRGTEALLQALRARTVDALVADVRSVAPAPDLHVEPLAELRGGFLVRRRHPLLRRRRAVAFDAVRAYPIASTPLSDEVARILVERYGPAALPAQCVTLRCDDVISMAEVARRSDTVLLAVCAAAPDLAELALDPPLDASARYGLVTLAGRSAAPALPLLRTVVRALLEAP